MRVVLAAVLAAHGIAHLVGFGVNWQLIQSPEVPYRTTVLSGLVDVGTIGTRAIGLLWALTALTFVVAAVGVGWRWESAYALTVTAVIISTILCGVSLPQAHIGLLLNVLIGTALVVASFAAADVF